MKKLVIFAAATMLAVPAIAADAIVYAPEAAPVEYAQGFNWSGAYIGAHAGYGWGKTEDANNARAPEKKMKGGLGGLQAGYNWQFDNNLVLGAEADVSFSGVKKNWVELEEGTETWSSTSSYYTKDKIGTNGTVRARLGYAADRFLPFVTGGLAWADMKHTVGCFDKATIPGLPAGASQTCRAANNNTFEGSKSKTVFGYSVGAGVEYAVTDNWTLKAEYLYSNFGKHKVTIVDPNVTLPADMYKNERSFKTHLSEVRVGVNYKF